MRFDGRAGSGAVIQDVPDGTDISVKLEKKGELFRLRNIRSLHKDFLGIQLLFQDLGAEPFRYQRDLEFSGISVIGVRAEIYDAVRVERGAVPLCVKGNADCSRYRLRLIVDNAAVLILNKKGGMNIFQVVFDLIVVNGHNLYLRFKNI